MVKVIKLSFLGILFYLPFCGSGMNPLLFWCVCAAVIFLFSCSMILSGYSAGLTGKESLDILPAVLICCLPVVFSAIAGKGVIGAAETSWVIYLLLFVLSCVTLKNTKDLELLSVTMSLSALAAALIGLYQYLIGFSLWSNAHLIAETAGSSSVLLGEIQKNIAEKRVFSVFINSNVYAGYVAMLLPPSLALCFAGGGRKTKLLGLVSAAVAVLMLVLSRSFGGSLSAAAGIALFFAVRFGRKKKTLILAAVLAALLVLFAYLLKPELVDFSHPRNPLFGRLNYWLDAWKIYRDTGILGGGTGVFKRFSVSGVLYPHNMYLQFLLEYGIIGFSLLLLFLFPFLKAPAEAASINNKGSKTLLAGLLGACAAFLLHSFIDIDSNYFQNTSVFFVFGGAVAAAGLYKSGRLRFVFPAGRGYTAVILGLSIVTSIILGKEHAFNLALSAVLLTIGAAIILLDKREIPAGKIVHAALLFFAILVLSAFGSKNPSRSLTELVRVGCLAAAFFLGWSMRGSPGFGERTAVFTAKIGIAVSLLFSFTHFSGGAEIFFPNKNLLGGFLVACAALCLPYVCFRNAADKSGRKGILPAETKDTGFKSAAIYLWRAMFNLKNVAVIFSCFGVVLTGSRGAQIALAAVIILFVMQSGAFVRKGMLHGRIRFFTTFAILVLAAAALLLPGGLADRFAAKGNSDPLAFERTGIYKSALSMAKESPVRGVGLGCFGGAYWKHKLPVNVAISRYERNTDFAHNEHLQCFAETGVPGGVLALCLVFLVLFYAWKAFYASGRRDALFLSGAALVLTAVFIHALVDFNLHFMPILILTGALAGYSCGAYEKKSLALGGRVPFLMSVFILLAALTPVFSALAELSARESTRAESCAKEGFVKAARVLDPLSAEYSDRYALLLLERRAGNEQAVRNLAEQEFKSACSLDGFDPYYPRHLGRLYAANFMEEEAQAAFAEAYARSPFDPFIMTDLAEVKFALNDWEGCAAMLEKSILVEPNYAAGCYKLGRLYSITGNEKGAQALKDRALQTRKALLPNVNTDYERALLELK